MNSDDQMITAGRTGQFILSVHVASRAILVTQEACTAGTSLLWQSLLRQFPRGKGLCVPKT
jgi:hypothetical protein